MAENNEIKFGTDGWRAVIADTFTFKNVKILSQAISEWVNNDAPAIAGHEKKVAIGYDPRFMSGEFAQLVARVLAANNIPVLLSEAPTPTPALSKGTLRNHCVAGIMVTASHNPYQFNGIKIKTAQGGGAGKNITDKEEQYLNRVEVKIADLRSAKENNKIIIHNYKDDYLKFIKSYINLKKIKNSRFKVLTDAMHGSGNALMREVLKGTKIRLTLMREGI